MTRHSSLAQARHTLLNSLGLPPDASDEELAAKKAELSSSLETAPEGRTEWITQQIAKVDAVIALGAAEGGADAEGSDPSGDEPDPAEDPSPEPDDPATEAADPDDPVALDEIDDVAEARRLARKAARKNSVNGVDTAPSRTASKASASKSAASRTTGNKAASRRRADTTSWVARIVIVAIVVAVVLAVYKLGAPAGSSDSDASELMGMGSSATPTLDAAQVAELEQRIADDPEDTDAMAQLASLYAAVGDYENASKWQARRVELMPDDVDAQLTLGVSCFNNGDLDCAKEHWDVVNELDPDRADLHFNLGYYYLSIDPPDIEMVKKEWNRVLELEPDGQYAQIIESHMGSLDTMTATASASTTP